jgi:hypothetical protein
METKKQPKRPRKPRREYGPSYFAEKMCGLASAARKVAREEQLLLNFNSTGKAVN